ncbi:SCO family protein [Algicola sagamiensis]|uniref:SCO family protein n=1 Tax=Algicola sagamiensis TaxID=163869 RepID=UPI00036C32D3|nr:SCO family protein [Algicola sagamiensis]
MSKYLLLIISLLAFGSGVFAWKYQSPSRHDVKALWYEAPRVMQPFLLEQSGGGTFTEKSLEGKWSLIFLGFTSCPDVCPTTMSKLAGIYPAITEATSIESQIVMVSVDPRRDSVEKLSQYVQYFNPKFIGATGKHKTLYPFTRQLGLMYVMVDDEHAEGSYSVDHSASIVLINPKAEVEAIFKPAFIKGKIPTVDEQQLVKDFTIISQAWSA